MLYNRMANKIMMLSDSILGSTGFGTVTRDLGIRLDKQSDMNVVNVSWNYHGQDLESVRFKEGFNIDFPILSGSKQKYAADLIESYLREHKPDVFYVLLDSFMLMQTGYMNKDFAPAKSIMYFPSDGAFFPKQCENILNKFDHTVAMANHGMRQLKWLYKNNYINLPVHKKMTHIPHAVDETHYYPYTPEKKAKARASFNIPQNAFVIGVVARNQGRKFLDRTMKAFSEVVWGDDDNKPINDAYLFMHSDPGDNAAPTDLVDLTRRYKVEHRVIWSGMDFLRGVSMERMKDVFNVMDIHFLSTCYHPKTPITTASGFKNIENIEIGDEVLTKDGSFQKVEDTVSYEIDSELLNVKTSYNPDVLLTPNHKVYGMHCNGTSYQKKKLKDSPKLKLKEISEFSEGDYLAVPIVRKVKDKEAILFDKSYISNQFGKTDTLHPNSKNLGHVPIDEDFMWLAGYYVAEGCLSQRHGKPEGIVFSCSTEEQEFTDKVKRIVKEKFGLECTVKDGTRHRRTIRIYNSSLGRKFKKLFGSGAHVKKVPEWMVYLPKHKQEKLVEGYFDGDGYFNDGMYKCKEAQTVSSQLAHQMRMILFRLGKLVSLKTQERQSTVYRLRYAVDNKNSVGWMDDNFVYVRIASIKKEKYNGLVYDLTVENNHNYCNYWLGKNSGEGFGVPTVESMACGVPSVITDFTSSAELIHEHGQVGETVKLLGMPRIKYNSKTDFDNYAEVYAPTHELNKQGLTGSWNVERGLCDIKDAAAKIRKLYYDRKLLGKYAIAGREKVLKHYSWNNVVGPKWVNFVRKVANS